MRTAPLLVLVLLAAGCTGDETPPVAAGQESDGVLVTSDRPDPVYGNVTAGLSATADLNATLDAPPRLVPGEWWRIRLTSPLTGDDVEFYRVVADVDGDTYVVGMPHEGWWKEAVVYHTPALGDVGADLSYRAHNIPFQPVRFPLTDGATWTTHFETTTPLTAKVEVISPTEADVAFTDPNGKVVIELTYDAAVHEVRLFRHSTVVYEVLDHGYGFEGWITVPRGEELVFLHGRVATPFLSIAPLGPAPVSPGTHTETVTVQGGYNRLSFILGAGNLDGAPGGAYRETATAPDGTNYTLESIPGGPFRIAFFEAMNPDGEWRLEHLVAGAGYAFIEGIAYHQYDIHLPTGQRRSDHAHPVVR